VRDESAAQYGDKDYLLAIESTRARHDGLLRGSSSRGLAGGRTVENFNQCIFFALLIAVIISGFELLRGVPRLVRGTPDRAPSQA